MITSNECTLYETTLNRNRVQSTVQAEHRCRINQVKSFGLLIFQHGNKNLTLE